MKRARITEDLAYGTALDRLTGGKKAVSTGAPPEPKPTDDGDGDAADEDDPAEEADKGDKESSGKASDDKKRPAKTEPAGEAK